MKRILAVGCSHGNYADPDALAAVLRFKKEYKPHIIIHLGDALDCEAFMGGKKGDDCDPVSPDLESGVRFLTELQPDYFLFGNHEDRLDRLRDSSNELIAFAANQILEHIKSWAKKRKVKLIPYAGNEQNLTIGNVRFMHGTVYNENACRDHAEAFAPWHGTVVNAHTHRTGQATGRRADHPTGFGVGTLTKRGAFSYAKCRRATLGWSQGFVWGEIGEKESQLFLYEKQTANWMLP